MNRSAAGILLLAMVGPLLAVGTARRSALADEPVAYDVLLRGGLLFDGTGQQPRVGDVALAGDRIVAVGRLDAQRARRIVECDGLYICPGFIDLHNHSDSAILQPATRDAANYLTQGCTTLVTGNCGGGKAEVGEYLQALDRNGVGVNIVHLLPHGALRSQVMGNVNRAPTDDELAHMRQRTAQAMRDGAWGMSTGLIYVPSAYADTDELVALAQVVAQHGGIYASHIRGEGQTLLDAVDEAIAIGRRAQLPVHIAHFKASGQPYWGSVRAAAARIEQARASGLQVTADQYPYTASSTSLSAMLLPSEQREGSRDDLIRRAKDPQIAARWRAHLVQTLPERGELLIASYRPRPEWVGKRLSDIAAQEQRHPADVALEIFAGGDAGAVSFNMSEEDVRFVMQLPWVATASDGAVKVDDGTRPHPRSYGTFTRKIGRYALAEKVVSLEAAIRSATGLPADILRLKDRGYLRAGQFADVVVFDPQTLLDRATYEKPFEHSQGVRWVFVNGKAAVEESKPTGVLAGRALRHAAP
jgi:N-acyl-D-aspartate/D-glutamate deacylase